VLCAAVTGQLTANWREQTRAAAWTRVKLTAAGSIGRGKSRHRPRNDPKLYGGDYPFIQTGDIAGAKDVLSTHRQTYSKFGLAQSKLWPKDTLCITIAANIADTSILGYPACFPDSVVGFVSNPAMCDVRFVQFVIKVAKADIEREAPATAQRNINLSTLETLEIELPSVAEQAEIIRRVALLMSGADRMETRIQRALAGANSMSSATLAKAFRGELVPQDPADEPAQALLDRLRTAAAGPKARSRSSA
jgi:type I restriction enzyme S subunit